MSRVLAPHLADVQGMPDMRRMAIDKVGIKSLRHPVKVREKGGGLQNTTALCKLYVGLSRYCKGTHMSRLVEIINDPGLEISLGKLPELLREMMGKLEVNLGQIELTFPYFIRKSAPVSKVKSLMDYEVTIRAEIRGGKHSITVKVLVPVTSLCPCSKKIADYGAHSQRSHISVTANLNSFLWIEDLIDLVENQASCQLYGLLKRQDEKFVTELAYDNPKFVEDMVRDVATQLRADRRIGSFTVECENFESIHNHSAYAMINSANSYE